MILLMILLQIKGYAGSAIEKEIKALEIQREQVTQAQVELKDAFSQTLAYLDEALDEIASAKALLDKDVDKDALEALHEEEKLFNQQREELLATKGNADDRDLNAEITILDQKIASLKASLTKLPKEEK